MTTYKIDQIIDIQSLMCPICQDLLIDPIIADDGHMYNKKCFDHYIKKCHDDDNIAISPLTKQEVSSTTIPVLLMKQIITHMIKNSDVLNDHIQCLDINDVLNNDLYNDLYKSNKISDNFWHNVLLHRHDKHDMIRKYKIPNNCSHYSDTDGNNLLTLACALKDSVMAQYIFKNSEINYNCVNRQGENAMIIACKNAMYPVIFELMKKPNIDYEQCDLSGNNALLASCNCCIDASDNTVTIVRNNMESIIIKLLESSNKTICEKVNNKGDNILLSLHDNTFYKEIEIIGDILDNPFIDINCVNRYGDTLLHILLRSIVTSVPIVEKECEFYEVILKILDKSIIKYDFNDKLNNILLHICTYIDCTTLNCQYLRQIALKLLEHYVDYNLIDELTGYNALILACNSRSYDLINALLQFPDIDYNHKDLVGDTALIMMSSDNSHRGVRMALKLLDMNADYKHKNKDNVSALITGMGVDNYQVVDKILSLSGENIEVKKNELSQKCDMYINKFIPITFTSTTRTVCVVDFPSEKAQTIIFVKQLCTFIVCKQVDGCWFKIVINGMIGYIKLVEKSRVDTNKLDKYTIRIPESILNNCFALDN
jgi:hypothetical protein